MNYNYDLIVDLGRSGGQSQPLLEALTTSSRRTDTPSMVAGDDFTLRLFFAIPADALQSEADNQSLPDGSSIVFGVKTADDPGAASFLFDTSAFAKVTDADGIHYDATLNLNTTQLASAMLLPNSQTTRNTPLACDAAIQVQNSGNTERLTWLFNLNVAPQPITGVEGVPTDSDPPYPTPAQLVVKHFDLSNIAFNSDGTRLYLYCADGLWRPIVGAVTNNVASITLDQTGVAAVP